MFFFVYEYTCAFANGQTLPKSLRAEGAAMLSASLDDFAKILQTCTLLADDVAIRFPGQTYRTNGDEERRFRDLAKQADWTMVIAPETDGILATRCRWARESGSACLNCSDSAIELTADKMLLSNFLIERGIPAPMAFELSCATDGLTFPAVVKPRWGAGSQHVHFAEDAVSLVDLNKKRHESEMIVTQFVPGTPASVGFLIAHANHRLTLPPCRQLLSDDGHFCYQGGELPLPEPLRSRAASLADRAVDCIPGLHGFVGVDLVLGADADGSGDAVIEINPRLTTSYLGLRRLADFNLMKALLQLVQNKDVAPRWKNGRVIFHC